MVLDNVDIIQTNTEKRDIRTPPLNTVAVSRSSSPPFHLSVSEINQYGSFTFASAFALGVSSHFVFLGGQVPLCHASP